MFENLKSRFLNYVKINTRSDANSWSIPSTKGQVEFAKILVEELKEIGIENAFYNKENGVVQGSIPSNIEREVPVIGFIAHMDTADFNSENVKPKIIENYDGKSDIVLDKNEEYVLSVDKFPNLKNYKGDTLITTSGDTLLGADDKAGIAEIMTALEYIINNSDIKHGEVRVAFTPDEEIGTGANNFDVEEFGADFAWTVDGGPLGELQYETFNAACAEITFRGVNVHPGTAKGKMINSILLAMEFHNSLPKKDVPEKTENREGFYLLDEFSGGIEETKLHYLIRDHDKKKFNGRKKALEYIAKRMNKEMKKDLITVEIEDSYYNMEEIIKKDMRPFELAERAMLRLDIEPIVKPVRGGTDGAIISFMGLPTPNLFAGGENMHGRYEFISLQTMEKATEVIIEIIKLNADPF